MAIIKDSNIVLSSDIGSVLNTAGGSVNINQPHTFFTSAAKLNKWSLNKPFVHATNFFASATERANARYYANQGFDENSCPYFTNLYNMAKYMYSDGTSPNPDNGAIEEPFKYVLPSGSTSQPLRLEDFIGYDTNAVRPIEPMEDEYIAPEGTDMSTFTFKFPTNVNSSTSVGLTDLRMKVFGGNFDFNTCYFGIVIMDDVNIYAKTKEYRLNGGDWSDDIESDNLAISISDMPQAVIGSNYTVCCAFLSLSPINQMTSITSSGYSGRFIPLLWTKCPVFLFPDAFGTDAYVAGYCNMTSTGNYYTVHVRVKIVCHTSAKIEDYGKIVINGGGTNDGYQSDVGGTTIYAPNYENPGAYGEVIASGTYYTHVSNGYPSLGDNKISASFTMYMASNGLTKDFSITGPLSSNEDIFNEMGE